MKIKSTRRPDAQIASVLASPAVRPAPTAAEAGDVPVGVAALAHGSAGLRGGVVFRPTTVQETQSFTDFMQSPGVQVTRSLWGLLSPAVPPELRRGVDFALVVLDATSQFQAWNRLPPQAGPVDIASLALASAQSAASALSLLNAAAGRPTRQIDDIGLLLGYGRGVMAGKNMMWIDINTHLRSQSPVFKVADNTLRLIEAGLSADPALKGIALNPLRDLAGPNSRLAGLVSARPHVFAPFPVARKESP